jgi:hypothetical protein
MRLLQGLQSVCCVVGALLASAVSLRAQTLSFEANWFPSGDYTPVPITHLYGGFTWTFFGVVDRRFFGTDVNGFVTTAIRTNSDVVGYNEYGEVATLSRGSPFRFSSAWVASGQREGMVLDLRGYDALGIQVENAAYVIGSTPIQITPNWAKLWSVSFSATGGTPQTLVNTFAIDDIEVADVLYESTTAPEPATVGLLGIGLLGLAAAHRTRKP